jgi:TPR repeat protein
VRYVLQGGHAAELATDYAKARSLYEKAVASGSPQAAIRLARMYETGRGFRQSYVHADEWYKKAAKLGEPEAMEKIAGFYARSLGVRRSAAEARTWRQKAQVAKEQQAAAQSSLGSKIPERKSRAD